MRGMKLKKEEIVIVLCVLLCVLLIDLILDVMVEQLVIETNRTKTIPKKQWLPTIPFLPGS